MATDIFWNLAEIEYEKILDKICGDWRMRLNETHRQLKKMDQLNDLSSTDEEERKESDKKDEQNPEADKGEEDKKMETSYEHDIDIGRRFLKMKMNKFDERIEQSKLPGYQILKDRVIKPIIVATESLVEYYY